MRVFAAVVTVTAIGVVSVAPAVADGQGYRFFKTRGPAHAPGAYWNPCEVISYGIDFTYATKIGMRKSWERDRWRSAVEEVSQTMGVDFRYVGAVRSRSAGNRPRSLAGVDLVITFGKATKGGRYGYGRLLRGPVAGVAGVRWRSNGSNRRQVFGGYVVIDAKEVVRRTDEWKQPFDARPASVRSPDVVRSLYMHEFGHAVGLDHVRDKQQLMYPRLQPDRPDQLGAGDRKGLRKLGRQRCF